MPTSEGHGRWARELARGDVAMAWTPQWRLERLEAAAPELAGKLAMMPLPRFEAGDARTAVWGGSMLAIPRGAPDPEASWALLRHLAIDEGSLAASVAGRPAEGFYDRQDTRVLYRALEAEAPPQRVTPLDLAASGHLAAILSRAADARRAGVSGERLEGLLRQWLGDAQADLERRARFTD